MSSGHNYGSFGGLPTLSASVPQMQKLPAKLGEARGGSNLALPFFPCLSRGLHPELAFLANLVHDLSSGGSNGDSTNVLGMESI